MDEKDFYGADRLFTRSLRIPSRTYYIDAKEGASRNLYLTITERKKLSQRFPGAANQKQVIHIYPEDFAEFRKCLVEVMEYIDAQVPPAEDKFNSFPTIFNLEFDDLDTPPAP